MQSSCQGIRIQKLKHEMVTGKQNCKLFSSAGLHSQKSVKLRWSLCRGPGLSASGPGEAPRRAPALSGSASGPALSVSGPGALSVGAGALSVGAGALCRGPRFLCRGLALSALSVSGPNDLCHLCRGVLRQSLCRGQALSGSLCVPLCVGARRFLCRGPALPVGAGAAAGALCVGPGALSVRARRFSAVSVSGPGALSLCQGGAVYVGACRGPALSVSGPCALCWGFVSGRGSSLPTLSVSGQSLRGTALSMLGPGDLCRGLHRGPAVLSQRLLCRGVALSAALSASGPGALCRGPWSQCRAPALWRCRGPAVL